MLNTFENTQITTSRRRERERQLELMNHAANGTGPFSPDTIDSSGTWDDGLDDIDESLMLDVEGAYSKPKTPSPTNQVNNNGRKSNDDDILSPDEARAAALAALRAADRDHYANKAYRSSNRNMSPDRFRWSPPNVPDHDKDFEITDETLEEDHETDLDVAYHHAYSTTRRSPKNNKSAFHWGATFAHCGDRVITRRAALLSVLCVIVVVTVISGGIAGSKAKQQASTVSPPPPPPPPPSTTTEGLPQNNNGSSQQPLSSYYLMPFITSQGISSADALQDPNSPQYKALLWVSENSAASKSDIPTDRKVRIDKNLYGLAMLYYANIEPGDAQQFLQGTTYQQSSKQSQKNFFDPNLLDDFRTASDNSGINSATNATDNAQQWLSPSVHYCKWTGVECFGVGISEGQIKSLSLPKRGLVGSILEDVPRALGSLIQLDLSYNMLSGPIPNSIGVLTNATKIFLGGNQLEAALPSSLGSLTMLESLYLQENMLTGTIPTEIGQLKKLSALGLYQNNLERMIPSSIGNMSSLSVCYLDDNSLSGTIPSVIGSLKNLHDFRLSNNKLVGTIPAELGLMSALEMLYLDNNLFYGSIPSSIGSLSLLKELHLYKNDLSGTIPDTIQTLTNLQLLYLDNNKLTGSLPGNIGSLVHLESLYLFNNKLRGSLPASIGTLTNLTNVRLNDNKFNGPLPTNLGLLQKLQLLFLDTNDFTGTVPTEFGMLRRLEKFRLQGNSLQGNMPGNICSLRFGDMDELFADCKTKQFITCPTPSCCTKCF